MPLASEVKKDIYTGDDTTTVFPYTFMILDEDEIEVIQYTIADGTETVLTKTTDYTVSGVGEASGGDVTLTSALLDEYKLILRRALPLTNDQDLIQGDSFPTDVVDTTIDRIFMILQQQQEMLDRVVLRDSSNTAQIVLPQPESEKIIGWNTAGDGLENKTTLDADVQAACEAAQAAAEAAQTAAELAETNAETAETNAVAAAASVNEDDIHIPFDGFGSVLDTGIGGIDLYFKVARTIVGWTILADQSGAIKIDVWKDTYANYPPTDADSITNGHEPEIVASATNAQDLDVADWSGEAIAAGSTLRFNVDSVTSITKAVLVLHTERV